MKYQILYYNSIDRSWRTGEVMGKTLAKRFAKQYFGLLLRDNIMGEADKLYIGPYKEGADTWPSHVWSHSLKDWKELS